MAWESEEKCIACKTEHRLCWPNTDIPSNLLYLTYICPETSKKVAIYGIRAWVSSEVSEGSVILQEDKKS